MGLKPLVGAFLASISLAPHVLPLPVPAHHHDRIAHDAIVQVMSGIGDWTDALAGERAGRAETGMRLQQRKDARHAGLDQPGSMGILFGNVRKCGFIRGPFGARPLKPLFYAFRHAPLR